MKTLNPETHCPQCHEPLSLYSHCWQCEYPPMDPKQDASITATLLPEKID